MEELKKLVRGMDADEAIATLSAYIAGHPDDDKAYTLRGIKNWSAGNRGQAITDYLSAIRINPDSPAREALKAANEILDYRNKDLYNP